MFKFDESPHHAVRRLRDKAGLYKRAASLVGSPERIPRLARGRSATRHCYRAITAPALSILIMSLIIYVAGHYGELSPRTADIPPSRATTSV